MSAKMLAKKLARKFNIPRSRRGSVLVLIVGVLAMIALLVLVYSTLGQADRRGAASLAARTKLIDQAGSVRDYFGRVIGESAFNYSYQRTLLTKDGRPVDLRLRGAYDYPSTDPEFRSSRVNTPSTMQNINQFDARRFNPTGQVNGPWLAAEATDPRMATGQPWLASSEPTWIFPLAADNRAFTDPRLPSRDLHGWAHISNFAPSGNFVNLYMLRENASEPGSGFSVPSGVPSDTGDLRFSSKLTLRNPASVDRLSTTNIDAQTRADGKPAVLNRPYDWSTNQAGVVATVENNSDGRTQPGQPGYIWSEWIDTDGDGRPDARPFEFVDSTDPLYPVSVLALDPAYRWVFAARAIDLSGRVNVNTAIANFGTLASGAFDPTTLNPTESFPLGLTPAEVSLRLMLESPWLYDDNSQAHYGSLAATPASSPRYQNDYGNRNNAATIGGSAFSAAIFSRLYGVVPGRDNANVTAPFDNVLFPGQLPRSGGTGGLPDLRDIVENVPTVGDRLTRRGLANAYKIVQDPEGGTLTTNPRSVGATARVPTSISAGGFFSLSDLLELLTYNGANDEAVTSRLEQALDGRGSASGSSVDFPDVGPLRSNRERALEIGGKTFTQSNEQRAWEALTQMYSDVRSRLTTISGARPIGARVFGTLPKDDDAIAKFTSSDLRPDAGALVARMLATRPEELGLASSAWPSLFTQRQEAANDLLVAYGRALMPLIALRGATENDTPWARDPGRTTDALNIQTYAFGPAMVPAAGQGSLGTPRVERNPLSTAELALRRAAHMVVNLMGSRDTDELGWITANPADSSASPRQGDKPKLITDEVVGATLIFNGAQLTGSLVNLTGAEGTLPVRGTDIKATVYSGEPNGTAIFPFADELAGNTEARATVTDTGAFKRSTVLNLDHRATNASERVLDSRVLAAGTVARPVTIYAVKPQPFITSAVTMISYADVPDSTGTIDAVANPNTGEYDPINIRGNIDSSNADFLFQMAIVTLSNPFETDIDLSSDLKELTGDIERDYKYYVEFGGRYYKLLRRPVSGGDAEERIVLRSKQSIDFFVLSHDTAVIASRLSKFPSGTVTVEQVRTLIVNQLRNFNGFARPSNSDEDAFTRFRLWPSDLSNDTLITIPGNGTDVALMASQRSSLDEPFASMYGTGAGAKELDRQVRLWRAFRALPNNFGGAAPLVDETRRNSTGNDILVDRLRDPVDQTADPALTIALDNGTNEVNGTTSGPESTGPVGGTGSDNSGFTITLFGAIHRPREALPAGTTARADAFPVWTVEAKSSLKRANGYTAIRSRTPKNIADIVLNRQSGGQINPTSVMFSSTSTYSALRLRDWLNKLSGLPVGGGGGGSPIASSRLVNTDPNDATGFPGATQPMLVGTEELADNQRSTFRSYVPSFGFSRKQEESTTSRDGEQLPPIRATDMLTPLAFGPVHDPLRAAVSEDMATGRTLATQAASVPRHPANLDVQWTTLSEALAVAVDIDSPERLDDTDYFGGNPVFGTLSRGYIPTTRFVPFHDISGDGLFTQVGSTPPVNADPHVGSGIPFGLDILNQFRTSSVGSTLLLTPGVININTASRSVLSALPFAAVDHDPLAKALYGNVQANYEGKRDIAGYLMAYRDKTRVYLPTRSAWVDMRDTRAGRQDNISTGDDAGRRNTTGITALREAPGFQSLAEMLAARVAMRDNSDPLLLADFKTPVINGYGMDTAIASTMLASASVRSDTFAVWFTMDGYRQEDTQGLSIDDPLVPSIRKRYVMVVDRSNVVEKGQSPRILMFRELPTE